MSIFSKINRYCLVSSRLLLLSKIRFFGIQYNPKDITLECVQDKKKRCRFVKGKYIYKRANLLRSHEIF